MSDVSLGSATVKLGTDLTGLISGIATAKGLIAGLGTAALGVGAAVLDLGASYETAMTQLQNTTGSSDAQMKQYVATIRSVSDETGVAQTSLAKGMYQIVSANFAGVDAARILATATKDAVIAGADQTQVTTGLVVTLNAFKEKASQSDVVANQMFKTLGLGRGTMGDLAGALQTGAALVDHYGVSVTDMDAILATLSTGGMKTFGTSMTGLTQLLNIMDGKTDLIAKRFDKLGISFDEAKFKTMDVVQQIAYLNEVFKGHEDLMTSILGSKQAATALGILGTNTDLLTTNVKKLSAAQELAKEQQDAWTRTQGDFGFKMEAAKTQVINFAESIGVKLLPEAGKLVDWITQNGMPILNQFGGWFESQGLPALENFGGWIVGTGVPTVEKLANSFERNLLPPLESFGGWLISTGIPSFEHLATTVEQNMLPPIESLVTNAETLAIHFTEWANNSGTLRDVIGTTSEVLGTLVGWTADLVDWLDKGGPGVTALAIGIGLVGTAIAGIKLADWIYGWKGLADTFKDLAGNLMPNFTSAMQDAKDKAEKAATSVKSVGTEAEVVSGKQWFANLETSLDTVGTKADIAAADIGTIGPAAATTEVEVATQAGLMTTALGALAGPLGIGLAIAAFPLLVAGAQSAAQQLGSELQTALTDWSKQWSAQEKQQAKQLNEFMSQMGLGYKIDIPVAITVTVDKTQLDRAVNTFFIDLNGQLDPLAAQYLQMSEEKGSGQPNDIYGLFGQTNYGYGGTNKHAMGGVIPPGQYGIVNDQPGASTGELMYGGSSGISVLPADQTAAALRGGYGGGSRQPVHLHLHMSVNGRDFAEGIVHDMLAAEAHHIRLTTGSMR